MNGVIAVWEFIQDQILGMQWLNSVIGWMLSIVGVDITSKALSYGKLLTPNQIINYIERCSNA